ncbi:hypothetical protein U1Q18_041982 [Sarracenia purpurea var. burkii]
MKSFIISQEHHPNTGEREKRGRKSRPVGESFQRDLPPSPATSPPPSVLRPSPPPIKSQDSVRILCRRTPTLHQPPLWSTFIVGDARHPAYAAAYCPNHLHRSRASIADRLLTILIQGLAATITKHISGNLVPMLRVTGLETPFPPIRR